MIESTCIYGAGILSRHLTALRSEIEGVIRSDDIENIHRMRVASRRMRSTLPLFGPCYPEKKVKVWEKQIRQVTRSLGAARDLDVQIEMLERTIHQLPRIEYRPGIRRLHTRFRQQRDKLQLSVIQSMQELNRSGILEDMAAELAPLEAQAEKAQPYPLELYELAHRSIAETRARLLSHEDSIYQPEKVDELHAMRIDAKHLRYTIEIFAPIYSDALKPALTTIKEVQEFLGNIHDCDVWIALLPDFNLRERRRTLKYYGYEAPCNLLQPGLDYFLAHKQEERTALYEAFIQKWQGWLTEGVWDALQRIILQPVTFVSDRSIPPSSEQAELK